VLVPDEMASVRERTHCKHVAWSLAGQELLTVCPYRYLLSVPAMCQFLGRSCLQYVRTVTCFQYQLCANSWAGVAYSTSVPLLAFSTSSLPILGQELLTVRPYHYLLSVPALCQFLERSLS
jgi:hypothetical protein